MSVNLLHLLDFEKVDALLEGFNRSTGFVTAILDLDGKVLSKSGWRTMCTRFHRIHPETSQRCTISDTLLAGKMSEGEKYHFYTCLNGLVDVAVPLKIKGEHFANLFSGQFFFEEPDREFFLRQAREFGFDEREYLEAMDQVPVVSKEKVLTVMDFLLNMTQLICDLAYQKLEQEELDSALRKSEEQHRSILQTAMDGFWLIDMKGRILDVNQTYCRMSGYTEEELLTMIIPDLEVEESAEETALHLQKLTLTGEDRFETRHRRKDGSVFDVEVSVQYRLKDDAHCVVFMKDITERVQAKKALFDTNRLIQSILDNSPALIYLFDLQGKFLQVNKPFGALFQVAPADFVGKTREAFMPEEIARQHRNNDLQVIQTGSPLTFEEENPEADGLHHYLTQKFPLFDSENNVYAIAGISTDITERKRTEMEKQKFVMLADSSSEFIGMCDLEFSPLYVNPSGIEMVGLPDMAAACRVKVQDYFFPEDQQFITEEFFPRVLREGHGDVEIRLRHFRTGEEIWMYYYLFSVRDPGGTAIGWATVSRDITERKETERRLIASEKKYRTLFENMNAGFVLFEVVSDHQGVPIDLVILLANEGFHQTTGLNLKDSIGRRLREVLPGIENDEADWIGTYSRVAMSGESIQFIQGSELLGVYYSIAAFQAGPGQCAVTFVDITEQKRAEEALQKSEQDYRSLAESLEQQVIERTAQLLSVNKELETFTYSVSHDLKAPLRGIDGYSRLLLDLHSKDLDPEAQRFLSTIRSATLQMNQLIDDLLDYSRLERVVMKRETINMREMVGSVLKVYESDPAYKHYTFNVAIPEIQIFAAEKGLTMALRNLIDNALKFSCHESVPVIKIGLTENPATWLIQVQDNGIGFDMKYSQRIFEIFQRLHRVEEYPGTGVGLAMVTKAMQRMNGKVWAESSPGSGATFFLEIPKQTDNGLNVQ